MLGQGYKRINMRRFINEKGTFEIKVPITWRYSIKDGKVHTFQEYEIWKSDAFQLSINELDTDEKKANFESFLKTLPTTKIDDEDFYNLPDSGDEEFTTKTWTKLYVDKSVFFTLTHPNNTDPELDSRSIEDKVLLVHSIMKEFKIIETGESIETINSYRFEMFLQGVGAAALILSKAVKNKAFIEATCLLANQIDALLRIGIVLKNQLINGNSDIEIEWIYQGLADKKKSEKDIYKNALDLEIIDQTVYDELFKLYDDRNRVIHRFVISEITLAEVEEIAYRYYRQQEAINKIIYDLEAEQITLGIGMTTTSDNVHGEDEHLDFIKGKIGKIDYFDDKKQENKDSAKID